MPRLRKTKALQKCGAFCFSPLRHRGCVDDLIAPMILDLPTQLGSGFKSPVQRVRVISEGWGESNLYCVSCRADHLRRSAANTRVVDFACNRCGASYQLKSRSAPFGSRIVDAAYGAMCDAITSGRVPNLFALQYDPYGWRVENLFLIPSFAMSMSAIHARKPLSAKARRKGWVGCYIVLGRIPPDARIALVEKGAIVAPNRVRLKYERLRPLANLDYQLRGWTMDVLNLVRQLGKSQFSLGELYDRSGELARLHPRNRHVNEKVRQQLQRLRDMGLVEFLGRGTYRLTD